MDGELDALRRDHPGWLFGIRAPEGRTVYFAKRENITVEAMGTAKLDAIVAREERRNGWDMPADAGLANLREDHPRWRFGKTTDDGGSGVYRAWRGPVSIEAPSTAQLRALVTAEEHKQGWSRS